MSSQANITTQPSAEPELLARSVLYSFASRCLVDPMLAPFARAADVDTAEAAAQYLDEPKLAQIAAQVGRVLPIEKAETSAGYLGIYGMDVAAQASPYEIEFELKPDVFFRTQQLADVAGFYKAFTLDPMHGERPDHIAVEAEFLQYLLERKIAARQLNHGLEKEAILDDAFHNFFRDHFGRWATAFARSLSAVAKVRDNHFYPAAALFLEHFSKVETRRLGLKKSDLRLPRTAPMPIAMASSPENDGCQGCG